jgi:hypothetical protein
VQLVRRVVLETLQVHPRVSFQRIASPERVATLAQVLPEFPTFAGRKIAGAIAVLDWDHKLPSQEVILRVHLGYEPSAVMAMEHALRERVTRIAAQERYPEFDISDFVGLPGDEIYEGALKPDLSIQSWHFASSWRRTVMHSDSARAIATVLRSEQLAQARAMYGDRRVDDLEVVGWIPPCESGHGKWTLDVWWLTEIAGQIGKGHSFLVEMPAPQSERVVLARQFTLRIG